MIESHKTSTMAACVLCTVNLIAIVLSLSVFSLGLWIILSPNSLTVVANLTGNPVIKVLFRPEVLSLQLGVGLAFVAIFVFCISFMGFYGAVAKSQFLLFMYSTLVLLLLLLECALFYYFSSRFLEKGLEEREPEWSHTVRLAYSCCDKNVTFWTSNPDSEIPWSCCSAKSYPDKCTISEVYEKDCNTVISGWLRRYQTSLYTSLAVLHVILASCSLLRRPRTHPFLSNS